METSSPQLHKWASSKKTYKEIRLPKPWPPSQHTHTHTHTYTHSTTNHQWFSADCSSSHECSRCRWRAAWCWCNSPRSRSLYPLLDWPWRLAVHQTNITVHNCTIYQYSHRWWWRALPWVGCPRRRCNRCQGWTSSRPAASPHPPDTVRWILTEADCSGSMQPAQTIISIIILI